ncbi:hypothetical protein Y032_0169g216 [Ancylostoma ceylanicum]|uniref:Uncharacterized protein n=1 Tax=Ancylostoma ceylanicum TaxID=53326 RepID=A0A016SWC2_9BILA|nr:hypothetical protein Y032_0169g216 [Ancylostoma ceylanicum]
MYPSNSLQSPPGSQLQKSANAMDPSCPDRWHANPCQSLLLGPGRKDFLEDLIIGDESWVLNYSNAHRAMWLSPGEDPPTQAKSDLHPKKCLLCCFWDLREMLYYELLPQGHIATGTVYANQLQNVAKAVRERRPR